MEQSQRIAIPRAAAALSAIGQLSPTLSDGRGPPKNSLRERRMRMRQ
jgi:hypothetical protein